ncbi:hypothetical protein [Pleionea litopenaei]|uniref:Uncharacterized protein n=1 Tax=Pleionea litopenaei TaxID=3070815 RepID=A0AA51RWB1_9GAMM|nr:hypothetical protein [Pleionea sp. HL-JVS1]WMS88767.1 hypothetical protein Q9312_07570 [Pleionea sp. HL-JVS1]
MALRLFSGNISLYFGQFYIDEPEQSEEKLPEDSDVQDDDLYLDIDSAFESQNNGLCGACHQGKLFFIAGPQDGTAQVMVEVLDEEPPIFEQAEDVVECSFRAMSDQLHLCEWANEKTYLLNLPVGQYVVRYTITGTDADYSESDPIDKPLPGQRYVVQFWPGNISSDRIVLANSQKGHYWHKQLGKNSA